MTISSTTRKAGPFIGNGTTTAFPFAYKVFQASDLLVVRLDTALNIEQELTLNSDYTVTLNLDQDSNPGGTVNLLAALATGYTLTLTSDLPNLQPTDLTNQGGFYPDVINDALDRATIQTQQLAQVTSRSLQFTLSETGGNPTLPSLDARKGTVLLFDAATGNPTVGPSFGDINTINAALNSIQTVANDLNGLDTIGTVASNIGVVQAAPANAALAQDAVTYLESYINQVIMNITFPLDLGLVADPVIYNSFDLGAV